MFTELPQIEDAVHVFVAKPLSLGIFGVWIVGKWAVLGAIKLARWGRRHSGFQTGPSNR